MLLCFIICSMFLCTTSAVPRQRHSQTNSGDITDYLSRARIKRSVIGIGSAAVAKILNGAKYIYSQTLRRGRERLFVKSGGYDQARKDFDKFNIENVKTSRSIWNTVRQTGDVDNIRVELQRSQVNKSTKLKITTMPRTSSNSKMYTDIILYKD